MGPYMILKGSLWAFYGPVLMALIVSTECQSRISSLRIEPYRPFLKILFKVL